MSAGAHQFVFVSLSSLGFSPFRRESRAHSLYSMQRVVFQHWRAPSRRTRANLGLGRNRPAVGRCRACSGRIWQTLARIRPLSDEFGQISLDFWQVWPTKLGVDQFGGGLDKMPSTVSPNLARDGPPCGHADQVLPDVEQFGAACHCRLAIVSAAFGPTGGIAGPSTRQTPREGRSSTAPFAEGVQLSFEDTLDATRFRGHVDREAAMRRPRHAKSGGPRRPVCALSGDGAAQQHPLSGRRCGETGRGAA